MKNLVFIVLSLVFSLVLFGCAGTDPDYDKAKRKAITVRQTERGVEVTVNESILFDTGKYELKQDSANILDRVSKILNERTKKDILIEGHTDNVGSAQLNNRLSEQRAESVKTTLVNRGVAATRMKTVGLGMTRPIGNNDTAEGRQLNRRTEIILLGETTDNIGGDGAVNFLEGAVARLKDMGSNVLNLFR